MENSSPSPTSPALAITFPPKAFGVGWVLLTAIGVVIIFFIPPIIGTAVWLGSHGMNTVLLQKEMLGLFGVGLQSAGEVAGVLFLIAVLPAVSRMSLRAMGFRMPAASDAGKIALAIFLMFVVVTALGSLLSTALHFKTPELAIKVFTQLQGWQKALFALFAIVVGPVAEECVFRLFLFNAMRAWWGFWPGAIVSSALFGLAHAQPPFTPVMFLALSLPLAVGGIVLCSVYARTGSILSNMITHATFNALSVALITVAPQLAK